MQKETLFCRNLLSFSHVSSSSTNNQTYERFWFCFVVFVLFFPPERASIKEINAPSPRAHTSLALEVFVMDTRCIKFRATLLPSGPLLLRFSPRRQRCGSCRICRMRETFGNSTISFRPRNEGHGVRSAANRGGFGWKK